MYMQEMIQEHGDLRQTIRTKLRQNFDGKIVRKDLTKRIKEGANVPVYVLEFLLGQYCSSDDEEIIEQGVQSVKRILADNFVRPDEAQRDTIAVRRMVSLREQVLERTVMQRNPAMLHLVCSQRTAKESAER